jgi:hypothetical protein
MGIEQNCTAALTKENLKSGIIGKVIYCTNKNYNLAFYNLA